MRRILSAILAAVVFVSCFSLASCSSNNDSADSEGKVKVVTTIFPVYDWVRNVAGEDNSNVDITMLLDSGIDLHNYQPSSEDILKISDCDVFIYVGGESDEWVESAGYGYLKPYRSTRRYGQGGGIHRGNAGRRG